jgi:hypothetical protein
MVQLLKLVYNLWDWAKKSGLVQAGQDKEVAEASLKVLQATDNGKELLRKISMLSDKEADDLWEAMLAHGKQEEKKE